MKKVISLLLALVMCLSLCACGGGNSDTTETTEPITAREVEALAFAVNYIKRFLKDPNSMEIHNVRYANDQESMPAFYYFEIDYTSDNSFGGAVRDTIYISVFVPVNGAEIGNDKIFTDRVEYGGLEYASDVIKKYFDERLDLAITMDKTSIEEAMGMT
jgi:hypothetical protein